jgi:lipoprotein-releasing system permease protein
MYKPLSAFIGLRYLGAKKQNHFISFISLTSMLGIALGVTTLITVISVMNGFEKELRARILGAISHATIQPLEKPLDNWREVIRNVEQRDDVVAAAPYIEVGAWLQAEGSSAALVRGVVPDYEAAVSDVATHMIAGKLSDLRAGEFGIVLGIGLAVHLQVGPSSPRDSRQVHSAPAH